MLPQIVHRQIRQRARSQLEAALVDAASRPAACAAPMPTSRSRQPEGWRITDFSLEHVAKLTQAVILSEAKDLPSGSTAI
jgi:hypothetical protein